MDHIEIEIDPLAHCREDDELIGIVDENSVASQDMLHHPDDVTYTFKEENDVVAYQVVQIPDVKSTVMSSANVTTSDITSQQQCQFYVISNASEYVAPPNIAQKLNNTRPVPHIVKKRDERRRATHNEVERRRRDKINHWIMKLGSIIPADGLPGGETDRPNVTSSEGQSKGGILSKACEYIPILQDNINSLNECLRDSEKLNVENQRLRATNNRLRIENEFLQAQLIKHGLTIDKTGLNLDKEYKSDMS